MKVSVIIPTWNRANTIEKAVRSALNQTMPDMEALVCDDGSTDDTFRIVNSIADPRVKWIGGAHAGIPAVPRNRGIAEADVAWYLFELAHDLEIDLPTAIMTKMAKNAAKYPVEKCKGRHTKYNKL